MQSPTRSWRQCACPIELTVVVIQNFEILMEICGQRSCRAERSASKTFKALSTQNGVARGFRGSFSSILLTHISISISDVHHLERWQLSTASWHMLAGRTPLAKPASLPRGPTSLVPCLSGAMWHQVRLIWSFRKRLAGRSTNHCSPLASDRSFCRLCGDSLFHLLPFALQCAHPVHPSRSRPKRSK
jgi:hypothetical protein